LKEEDFKNLRVVNLDYKLGDCCYANGDAVSVQILKEDVGGKVFQVDWKLMRYREADGTSVGPFGDWNNLE
jgi:hypothetical protein